jgi:hypothetical protein
MSNRIAISFCVWKNCAGVAAFVSSIEIGGG